MEISQGIRYSYETIMEAFSFNRVCCRRNRFICSRPIGWKHPVTSLLFLVSFRRPFPHSAPLEEPSIILMGTYITGTRLIDTDRFPHSNALKSIHYHHHPPPVRACLRTKQFSLSSVITDIIMRNGLFHFDRDRPWCTFQEILCFRILCKLSFM